MVSKENGVLTDKKYVSIIITNTLSCSISAFKIQCLVFTKKKNEKGEKGSSVNISEVKKLLEVEVDEVVKKFESYVSENNTCQFKETVHLSNI